LKSRWQKLAALADRGSTPAERAAAERALRRMSVAGEVAHVLLDVTEAWDLALLDAICRRHDVRVFADDSGLTRLEAGDRELDDALSTYVIARPEIERLVFSTVAGFLVARFPDGVGTAGGTGAGDRLDPAVARAAHDAVGRTWEPPKGVITGPAPARIESGDRRR
jgi:hypothetical protein